MTEIHPIRLGFDTCYVLRDAGIVVVDAGQPNKGRAFVRGLSRAAIAPQDVGLILLSRPVSPHGDGSSWPSTAS